MESNTWNLSTRKRYAVGSTAHGEDGGWGQGAGKVSYRLYYHALLSKPVERWGVRDKTKVVDKATSYEGTNAGFFGEFSTSDGEIVQMKVGISLVNAEGAKSNLAAEIPSWDFEQTLRSNRQLWKEAFDYVQFRGGTQKRPCGDGHGALPRNA